MSKIEKLVMSKIEKLDILDLMEVKGGGAFEIDAKCLFGAAVKCTVRNSGFFNCNVEGSGIIVSSPPPTEPENPSTPAVY